ncbi:insulinase family protein, partial [Rhodobacteraceae bacterium R_SAG3]|nr:insulinase family protein [Rhodobacteraceae bacterium R_SAG3]
MTSEAAIPSGLRASWRGALCALVMAAGLGAPVLSAQEASPASDAAPKSEQTGVEMVTTFTLENGMMVVVVE